MDNVDNLQILRSAKVEKNLKHLITADTPDFLSDPDGEKKYPHIYPAENVDKYVDIVDNPSDSQ